MSIVFLFPGQGSQSLNMMSALEHFNIVRETFTEASDIINDDLWSLSVSDDVEAINQTEITQPLMLTAGIATYRLYQQFGGPKADYFAGHSLGEYTALVAAGVLSFTDALKLVKIRAQLMQEVLPLGYGAMAAIIGLDSEQVIDICFDSSKNGTIAEPANYNSTNQIVIAGHLEAVKKACLLAEKNGALKVVMLPVSVPSHCSLLKPAALLFEKYLNKIHFKKVDGKVIQNTDVVYFDRVEDIKNALVKQLYSPVRWTETINYLVNNGVYLSAECGPGKVLAGLVKRISKEISCISFSSEKEIHDFISKVTI